MKPEARGAGQVQRRHGAPGGVGGARAPPGRHLAVARTSADAGAVTDATNAGVGGESFIGAAGYRSVNNWSGAGAAAGEGAYVAASIAWAWS